MAGSNASARSSAACPTASRSALSLICRSVSSTSLTLKRYLRGSGWVYWTADRTSTRLVSAVSMRASSGMLYCCETFTMILRSMGQGRCQLYPGPLLRIDAVQAARDPHDADQHQHRAEAAREARRGGAAAVSATAEQRRQAPLQVAQYVVQVVLRLLRTVPGVALLAAGFVPSHGYTQLRTYSLIISSRAF